jgi:hypothetical protein
MLPRTGLGTSIAESFLYSLIVLCLARFFSYSTFLNKKLLAKKKISLLDFLIIFLINFFIFYACLIADLVRGWEFLTFAVIFFPLVFCIDSFFIGLKILYKKDIVG